VGALLNRRLFEEPILAWQHGTVIQSLYDEFKHCKASPIIELSIDFDLETLTATVNQIPKNDKDIIEVLEKVWGVYKHFSASALRNKTHEPDTPWNCVYNGNKTTQVPAELINQHFIETIGAYFE
ncbi:MAG: type II toxin-antitoxin system antitoxin SocA domain-containing protein, partial [Cyanobacteria bacterium J06649_11]